MDGALETKGAAKPRSLTMYAKLLGVGYTHLWRCMRGGYMGCSPTPLLLKAERVAPSIFGHPRMRREAVDRMNHERSWYRWDFDAGKFVLKDRFDRRCKDFDENGGRDDPRW